MPPPAMATLSWSMKKGSDLVDLTPECREARGQINRSDPRTHLSIPPGRSDLPARAAVAEHLQRRRPVRIDVVGLDGAERRLAGHVAARQEGAHVVGERVRQLQ